MRVDPMMSEATPTVGPMNLDSLVSLGLTVVCETCESEIDVLDDDIGRGVCRHCGIAFLLDPVSAPRAARLSA